jgi:peptidyl-prolyl cis-trans isomerase C
LRRTGLAALAGLLSASCTDFTDPAVVTIDGESLTLADLRRAYAELDSHRPLLGTREQRAAFVENVVDRRLLQNHGRDIAAADSTVGEALERQRRAILVRRLMTLEAGEPSISPEEVEAAYARMGFRQRVERASFLSEEAARAAAAEIQAGADFAAAVERAGGLRHQRDAWVQWTTSPDPVAEAVAQLEPGALSEPVNDDPLVLLVRLLEREALALPPLEEVRTRIIAGLRVRRQAERVEALGERLRAERGVRLHSDGVDLLVRRTSEAIGESLDEGLESGWAMPRLSPEDRDVVVAEWSGGERWTAADYRVALESTAPVQRPQLHLRREVEAACRAGVTRELLVDEALRRELDREWWAARALARAREDHLAAVAIDRMGRDLEIDPAELDSIATVLESVQPQIFERGAIARVLWFDYPSPDVAGAEAKRLRAIGGRARLAEVLTEDRPVPFSYHITSVGSGALDVPEISNAVFREGVGAVSGPHDLGGTWIVAECLSLEPARRLTREEVLEDVRRRLRHGDQRVVQRWLVSRKEELRITVDEAGLDALAPGAG